MIALSYINLGEAASRILHRETSLLVTENCGQLFNRCEGFFQLLHCVILEIGSEYRRDNRVVQPGPRSCVGSRTAVYTPKAVRGDTWSVKAGYKGSQREIMGLSQGKRAFNSN